MKPDALLTADLHLRDTTPKCRTDDYFRAMNDKLDFIKKLLSLYCIPWFDAGDFFNKWESSSFLESWTINKLKNNNIYTVPGNHEIPYKNRNYLDRSALSVLNAANTIYVLKNGYKNPLIYKGENKNILIYGFPYGMEINNDTTMDVPSYIDKSKKVYKVAIIHKYIDKDDKGVFNKNGYNAYDLLYKLKDFQLIISGDNHITFTKSYKNTILVNPGSMMRSTVAQMNHKPCVFLWYAETNTVEQVFLPVMNNVFSIDHIEKQKENDKRIQTYVENLNNNYEIELSFKKNLDNYYKNNKVRNSIKNLISESIGK